MSVHHHGLFGGKGFTYRRLDIVVSQSPQFLFQLLCLHRA
jgi:hypothetical protein